MIVVNPRYIDPTPEHAPGTHTENVIPGPLFLLGNGPAAGRLRLFRGRYCWTLLTGIHSVLSVRYVQ